VLIERLAISDQPSVSKGRRQAGRRDPLFELGLGSLGSSINPSIHRGVPKCPWANRLNGFPKRNIRCLSIPTHAVASSDLGDEDLVQRYGLRWVEEETVETVS
jgi:hypothetical protein